MSVQSYAVTVTENSQRLVLADEGTPKVKVYIANWSGTDHVYVGDSNVTTANGYEIPNHNGSTIANRQEFEMFANEELYIVCAATKTADVRVLLVGIN